MQRFLVHFPNGAELVGPCPPGVDEWPPAGELVGGPLEHVAHIEPDHELPELYPAGVTIGPVMLRVAEWAHDDPAIDETVPAWVFYNDPAIDEAYYPGLIGGDSDLWGES